MMMNASSKSPPVRHQAVALVGWLALCFAASLSAFFVSIEGWYATLRKPSWNPPAWVFGPVWTMLYVLMAVAAWLVWRRGGWKKQRLPLCLFLLQWLLNAIWTPLFFGMHRIGLALADIAFLWIAIGTTIVLFWRVSKAAGTLLMPYLAWVSFATALNFALVRLNG